MPSSSSNRVRTFSHVESFPKTPPPGRTDFSSENASTPSRNLTPTAPTLTGQVKKTTKASPSELRKLRFEFLSIARQEPRWVQATAGGGKRRNTRYRRRPVKQVTQHNDTSTQRTQPTTARIAPNSPHASIARVSGRLSMVHRRKQSERRRHQQHQQPKQLSSQTNSKTRPSTTFQQSTKHASAQDCTKETDPTFSATLTRERGLQFSKRLARRGPITC